MHATRMMGVEERTRRRAGLALCALVAISVGARTGASQPSQAPPPIHEPPAASQVGDALLGETRPAWSPIFQGIEHAAFSTTTADGAPVAINALMVDLTAAGITPVATPGNGERPKETDGQTCSAFLQAHALAVAVNAHFFSPCCEPEHGQPKDLRGLMVSGGSVLSPHAPDGAISTLFCVARGAVERGHDANGAGAWRAWVVDARGRAVSLDADGRMVIGDDGERAGAGPVERVEIAAAGHLLLQGGLTRIAPDTVESRFSTTRHPRTAVGVLDGGESVLLVTVDGRQPVHSVGLSLPELAELMRRLGATAAVNLDGGGSTTMAVRGEHGAAVVNRPSGGAERVNGSHIGFEARALD